MAFNSHQVDRRSVLKGLGAAGAIAAAGPVLSACSTGGDSGSASSDPKTLNLMIPSWVDAKFISEVIQEKAGGKIGAKIKLVTVDDGTFPAQAASAQKAGQSPDMLMWTAQGIPVFLGAGVKLASLDDYVADEDKSAFYPQDYEANSIDGKLYGLGYRADCRGIAYRADFAPTPAPASWSFEQFGAWAGHLGGSGRVAFGFEAKPADGRASSNFLPLVWSTGAKFVSNESGKWAIGYSAEQMNQVMGFYYDTVNTWKITPKEVANWGYQETDSKFAKGTLASYSAGPFVTANTQKYPETRKNLKIGPLPFATKPANFWEELSFMIHADSKKKDLAWKFVEAMRSEEVQQAIVERTSDAWLGVRPAANKTITDDVLKSFVPLLDQAVVPEPINVNLIMNQAVFPTLDTIALKGTKPEAATELLMTKMKSSLNELNK